MAVLSSCSNQVLNQAADHQQEMILIPAGWFTMGSDHGPSSSAPARRVYLGSYLIDTHEVTQLRFKDYVLESGHRPAVWESGIPPTRPRIPMSGVLWKEAQQFCHWHDMRLPTEAEWEKAARGIDGHLYPWGDEWIPGAANTQELRLGGLVSVGMYPRGASPFGLMDMIGNVEEWVSDYYDPQYYRNSPRRDPEGPRIPLDHVLRGGSWNSPRQRANAIYRNSSHSVLPNDRVGFRCARDVED